MLLFKVRGLCILYLWRCEIPDGLRHEQLRKRGRLISIPLSVIIPVLISGLNMRSWGEYIIGVGIFLGFEMGQYCTPDWDIMGTSLDEGKIVNDIPILGHFIFGVSSTYGSIFRKHHRSFLTHFPFISTGIRFLFLFWWIFYQIYISSYDLYWLIFLFIGLFFGNGLSDMIHWWADLTDNKKD